jgi:phage N-6-adenine-methyltransferase
LRTGSIPVRATIGNKAGVDSPPLAAGELAPPPTLTFELSPQSSPKPKSGPTINRHESNQGYGTPWEFIRACEAKFRLPVVWDLAANAANAKADRWYDEAFNALVQPWHTLRPSGGLLWLNPPFGDIATWAEKCAAEARLGARILLLTPASVGTNWFRDHIYGQARVCALNGRITFVGASDPYPKDCMVSAYGCGGAGFEVWQWMKEVRHE